MGALEQYLELYRTHRQVIDENGAEVINALRPAAYSILEGGRLPRRGDEDYKNVDVEGLLAPDYGINLLKKELKVNPEMSLRCDLPVISTSILMNVNDTFAARRDALDTLPDGVDVGSLREFAGIEQKEVKAYYGKIADMSNPLVALNTLLAQDGLYLRVRRGVQLDQPIQLINILSSAYPLMAVRRILIVVEEGAAVKLLACDHTQRAGVEMMDLETIEVHVAAGAHFDYYHIEESSDSTRRLSTLYVEQEEGSHVNINGTTLSNGITRNEYYCRLMGREAELRLYGMGILDGDRVLGTYSHIDHRASHCKSNELFKMTADDRGNGAFTGRIHVAEGAVKTEAYQASRNLVGSEGARIDSKPQLEIYNDDVKCSHGCAIGQLDPMQIFYMRTRGIKEERARHLLRQAFMADVIDAIDWAPLRDKLHLLTERRFAGVRSACGGCKACNLKTGE